MAAYPSDFIHQFTHYFDKSSQTLPTKLFMKCHGNVPNMVIGFVILTASLGFTWTSYSTTYDLYYCTTWYFLLTTCAPYIVFWSHPDPLFNPLLKTLSATMKEIERGAPEAEVPKMRATCKRIKFLQSIMYSTHFSISAIVSLRRIPDAKLPVFLRGLPITNPWIISLQIVQCIINPPALISASHFFETVITLVICINDSLRVLSHRLENARSDEDLCTVIELHGQLLDCCGQLIDILEKWLFLISTSLFCVSLGVTMSMVGGVIDFENMLLLPGQMNSVLILCLFGDKLQEATECFADIAYSLHWYAGTSKRRGLVLMAITRAQKPLSLRCGVFGLLSFPVAMNVFNKWYKFLNFLLTI